jgi:hypothetical protein
MLGRRNIAKGMARAETVCWSQVGYATRCLGRHIVYKELECLGMEHDCCRVMGKPAEIWGENDELVQLYEREIVPADPVAAARSNSSNSRLKREDPVTSLLLVLAGVHVETLLRSLVPARRRAELFERRGVSLAARYRFVGFASAAVSASRCSPVVWAIACAPAAS